VSLSLSGLGFGGFPTQCSTDSGSPAPPGVPARWGLLVSALFDQRSQKQSECLPKARDKALAQAASGGDPDQHEHESRKHHANAAIHEAPLSQSLAEYAETCKVQLQWRIVSRNMGLAMVLIDISELTLYYSIIYCRAIGGRDPRRQHGARL